MQINRNAEDNVVLLPLKKYKKLDETKFIQSNKEYASHLLGVFNKMKAKSKKILSPETYKKI
jgi:PHD/YefM family antitoxin component YafN of YafNO toxin-antitoxin module